jgi:hypothetical protein
MIPKLMKALKAGDVQYTVHAQEQMSFRKLTALDVMSVGATCVHAQWQEDRRTYLVAGYASDGRGAAVSCKLDEGVIVITVMRRHLTRNERGGKK